MSNNTFKGTPGPWSWFVGRPELRRGNMSMKFLKSDKSGQGFAHTVGLHDPVDTHNACLIAVAPDMLEVLATIEQAIAAGHLPSEGLDENSPIRDSIRAIITALRESGAIS